MSDNRDPAVTMRIPVAMIGRIARAAKRAGQSRSEWIRRAIVSALKLGSERKARSRT